MEHQLRRDKIKKETRSFNNPFTDNPISHEIAGEATEPLIDPSLRLAEHDIANDFESVDKTA